jgi:hypothetical protein
MSITFSKPIEVCQTPNPMTRTAKKYSADFGIDFGSIDFK